ncbi:hypothetical protein ASPZODRAFT_132510 [Penicilliopsis zonata CBS 506.65]|uniref:Indole-diterpene biosynthesis protein PaxU n=1 Tax=Penicilliopsis zonata CBS 506.65 TaxID=1073090 RepID=A0A1L9SH22_9EURO|nr:hypothetical protein ASPZODRAFT_132510 [Penicilliopsis zonata CBS 506.65]OJJ46407.1 hypothetical protein ASPZODRAFT_132510 [Penicilliopsis zonata CBS 506.65]
MHKLSTTVYLDDPDNDTPKTQTIVLGLWMNAPPRASSKYLQEYRRLAPAARIIVILSSTSDFVLPPSQKKQQIRLSSAVETLLASETPVHIHLFSNGGVFSVTSLLAAYRQAAGHALDVSSIIIDSAPGTADFAGGFRAFSYALPKMWLLQALGKIVIGAVLGFLMCLKLVGLSDAVTTGRMALNDKDLVAGKAKRCYIYSEADQLVNWKDVEDHAREAERHWEVKREKFSDSQHVSHMRVDPERYSEIIKGYLVSK